jgi:ferric-dicitrate binding protein FerR (iron transport regulator)
VAADPVLAEALAQWRDVRAAVARELDAAAPAGDLLVLYALAGASPDALDEKDRAQLAIMKPSIEASLSIHPALADLVRRLGEDGRALDAMWDAQSAPAEVISWGSTTSTAAHRADVMGRPDRLPIRRARVTPLWSSVGRLAAVLALVGLGAIAALLMRRDAGLTRIVATENMEVELADGSSVELAAGSELLVPEASSVDPEAVSGDQSDGARRYARLVAGDALFRVARSTEHFVVETPAATVTVLGTTFGVSTTSSTTDVVLVNGIVDVAARSGGAVVRLSPGESSRVNAGESPAPAAQANVDAALAWTGDIFIRAEPLATAAARLAAALDVAIEVDSTLATEAVTGSFDRTENIETTLRALALAVDARVESVEGGYRLVPAGR